MVRTYQDDVLKYGRTREYAINDIGDGLSNIVENEDALETVGTRFGTEHVMGDCVLECDATAAGTTVTISHPSGAPSQFYFIAPKVFVATDTYRFQAGTESPVTLSITDSVNAPLRNGAWVQGAVVALTRQGNAAYTNISDKSFTVNTVLSVQSWAGASPPYTIQNHTVNGVTATSNGFTSVAQTATPQQADVARGASLRVTGQGQNRLSIAADSEKPTVDIPISTVIVR